MRDFNFRAKGFTVIELVVGLIIFAILALTVLQRLVPLENDAKAAVLAEVAGAMKDSLQLINAKAISTGKADGEQTISYNNVDLKLYNGYPLIDGSSSFTEINEQVSAWLDIDIVDRNTAREDRDVARFFSDKWSARNRMYIFFSEDYEQKSVNFQCQVMYENQIDGEGFRVEVLDSAC